MQKLQDEVFGACRTNEAIGDAGAGTSTEMRDRHHERVVVQLLVLRGLVHSNVEHRKRMAKIHTRDCFVADLKTSWSSSGWPEVLFVASH